MLEGGVHKSFQYWLVERETISKFKWSQKHSFASSPVFLTTSILMYMFVTWIMSFHHHPHLPSKLLHTISALHNLFLLLLSFFMSLGTILSCHSLLPSPSHLFCFPPSTPPSGPIFFYSYLFYLSKFFEFFDTLLILINPLKKPLSFLHVYHHSLVVLMSYLWLYSSQSLLPIALVTNASVHTLMYSYYFLSSLRFRPRWKRLVTDIQIFQFLFSFAASLLFLYYHFFGTANGCSGFGAWVFNAVFNASLLALFFNFHSKNYGGNKKKKKMMMMMNNNKEE